MDGFEKYQRIMADWATVVLGPFANNVFMGEPLDFSGHGTFEDIFIGFKEIVEAYEALQFSEILLSVDAPRSQKVSKERYIRFVVNTYLQDVYILKERLNSYATKIKRIHGRSGGEALTAVHIEPLFEMIKVNFKKIVDVRGKHVHQERFNDFFLNQASNLEFLSQFELKFKKDSKCANNQAQSEWCKTIRSNNVFTREILNNYFAELYRVVVITIGY